MISEFDDEGFGPSPTSYQRDFPSFVRDEDCASVVHNDTLRDESRIFKSRIMLPQSLKLDEDAGFVDKRSPVKNCDSNTDVRHKKKKKRPSPIKIAHDTPIFVEKDASRYNKKKSKKFDLENYMKSFEEIFTNIDDKIRSSRNSSLDSDRASYVSSSTSSDQRSLAVEIKRAKKIIQQHEAAKRQKSKYSDPLYESHFYIDDSENDTRPPSSEPTLGSSREIARRKTMKTSKHDGHDSISYLTQVSLKEAENARHQIASNNSVSRHSYSDINSNKSNKETQTRLATGRNYNVNETPILYPATTSLMTRKSDSNAKQPPIIASNQIENVRTNIEDDVGLSKGICQSFSDMTVGPKRFYLKSSDGKNRSLPNLERFIVRASNREIFNPPLDIDVIKGKGLRKDPQKAEQNFGGTRVNEIVHGAVSKPTSPTKCVDNRPSQKSTIASAAKQRERSLKREDNMMPYCSATNAPSGESYSVSSVGQQVLGRIKSLFPDWLPLAHRILNEKSLSADVSLIFRDELKRQAKNIEMKYRENRFIENADVLSSKLNVVQRVIDKIDMLLPSDRNKNSRVQQLKIIYSALHCL